MAVQRATIVGAGGLGGPVAISLGAAGLELTIVDDDRVELSNLHRQIQFTSSELDQPKAAWLAGLVVARGGTARGVASRWTAETADELGADADLIIDASDDPATKFAVADWAVASGLKVLELERRRLSLEEIFVKLTSEGEGR